MNAEALAVEGAEGSTRSRSTNAGSARSGWASGGSPRIGHPPTHGSPLHPRRHTHTNRMEQASAPSLDDAGGGRAVELWHGASDSKHHCRDADAGRRRHRWQRPNTQRDLGAERRPHLTTSGFADRVVLIRSPARAEALKRFLPLPRAFAGPKRPHRQAHAPRAAVAGSREPDPSLTGTRPPAPIGRSRVPHEDVGHARVQTARRRPRRRLQRIANPAV